MNFSAKIQTVIWQKIEFFGQFWLRLLKCRFCSPLAFNFFCAKIVNLAAPLHSKEAPREAFECFSLAKLHLSSASNELKNLILLSSLREWEIQNSRVQQRSFQKYILLHQNIFWSRCDLQKRFTFGELLLLEIRAFSLYMECKHSVTWVIFQTFSSSLTYLFYEQNKTKLLLGDFKSEGVRPGVGYHCQEKRDEMTRFTTF